MSEREHDRADLAEALDIIRKYAPGATSAQFSTSDQGRVGFVFYQVTLADGRTLSAEEFLPPQEQDEVWGLVSSIGWDGVMNDDYYGNATVSL